jgi:hypothetical protein
MTRVGILYQHVSPSYMTRVGILKQRLSPSYMTKVGILLWTTITRPRHVTKSDNIDL